MSIRKAFEMKKIIGIVLTFILMIGVCGCHMGNKEQKESKKEKKKQTDQEVVAEMKGYLYDKYGYIDYEFVSFLRSSTWGDPYDLMVLTTSYRGNDEAFFSVKRFDMDGKYVCADNYVEFLITDEFEEYMKEYTSNYFSEFKLYLAGGGYPGGEYPMSFKTFDDIKDRNDEIYDIVGSNAILHFYLYVKEDSLENIADFDIIAEKYEEDLKELDFRANCTWLICIDDENFNKIQEDNFRDYRKLGTAYQKVY